jgi:hypothetical protein
LEYLGNCLITKNFSPSSHHISAARQVENLVCTHRESLLGSSAWKPDFLKELQSRPFYMVKRASSHCFHDCNDYGEDGEKCQACGRSSQRPDHEIALFGPSYDSKKIWDSHWINLVPKALLLHVHHSSSSSSSSNSARSSSVTATPVHRTPKVVNSSITGMRNKQFQAYQSASGAKPTKRKISLSPIKHSSGKKNAIVLSEDEEDPNTRLVDSSVNGGVKKNAILLSDSEGEEEEVVPPKTVKQDIIDLSEEGVVKEEAVPSEDDNGSEEDNSSPSEEEGEENVAASSPVRSSSRKEGDDETPKKYRKGVSWWEKKIVKQLNKDPESKWHLSM